MKHSLLVNIISSLALLIGSGNALATSPNSSSAHVPDSDEMTYASVSHGNPFEIVPAAGMEVLDMSDEDGVDKELVSDMISLAHKYVGTHYRRGGKTPSGFDCSGFTSYIFGQFGYTLGASSADQYSDGRKINREDVEAGDLLFFTGRNSHSGRVGHVAIAIENDPLTGDITFIHAAVGGGIRIDKVSAPYYKARFLGARRVLD